MEAWRVSLRMKWHLVTLFRTEFGQQCTVVNVFIGSLCKLYSTSVASKGRNFTNKLKLLLSERSSSFSVLENSVWRFVSHHKVILLWMQSTYFCIKYDDSSILGIYHRYRLKEIIFFFYISYMIFIFFLIVSHPSCTDLSRRFYFLK